MKIFDDISPYDGRGNAACVIGINQFALDVSGSYEYRQGNPWIQAQCGKVVSDDSPLLDQLSSFRIVGKLAPASAQK